MHPVHLFFVFTGSCLISTAASFSCCSAVFIIILLSCIHHIAFDSFSCLCNTHPFASSLLGKPLTAIVGCLIFWAFAPSWKLIGWVEVDWCPVCLIVKAGDTFRKAFEIHHETQPSLKRWIWKSCGFNDWFNLIPNQASHGFREQEGWSLDSQLVSWSAKLWCR